MYSYTPRNEIPWRLTDDHRNSIEPTGGYAWSIHGHWWEKFGGWLFKIPSMAISGPPVENLWQPVDNF